MRRGHRLFRPVRCYYGWLILNNQRGTDAKKPPKGGFSLGDWQAEFMRIRIAFGWLTGLAPGMLL